MARNEYVSMRKAVASSPTCIWPMRPTVRLGTDRSISAFEVQLIPEGAAIQAYGDECYFVAYRVLLPFLDFGFRTGGSPLPRRAKPAMLALLRGKRFQCLSKIIAIGTGTQLSNLTEVLMCEVISELLGNLTKLHNPPNEQLGSAFL